MSHANNTRGVDGFNNGISHSVLSPVRAIPFKLQEVYPLLLCLNTEGGRHRLMITILPVVKTPVGSGE